jgi:hypothetical protein
MSTQVSQTQIAPPPEGLARGELVPVNPDRTDARDRAELDRQRQVTYVDLETWLKNVDRQIESINAEGELERLRIITKMRRFCAGEQIGRFNRQNRWENKKKQSDALYVDPVLSAFVDTNVATRMKSRPRLKFTARAEDRIDKSEAARYAQELWEDFSRQSFPASVRERENKNLEVCGDTFCFLYFDPQAEGTEVQMPVTEKRTVKPSFSSWHCPDCGSEGQVSPSADVTDGKHPCTKCGYQSASVTGAQPFEAEIEVGYEDVPAGDARAMFPDPVTVKVIGSKGKIADALVVGWDALVMRGVLEELYTDQTFTASASTLPPALDDEGKESRRGGEQFELILVKRRWLSPLLFGGYTFQKETKLPKGKTIPAGTKLKDLYPKGAYFCLAGGKLVDIYEQSIGSCWVHCPNVTTEGFRGLGSWDLIPMQEMINELVSLQFAIEMYDSLSPTLYRTGKINPKKIPNKPAAMVAVSNLDDDQPLSSAMTRVGGGGGQSQAAALREQIAGSMQMRYGSWSAQGGAPDLKQQGTATGAAIVQENAMGRMAPSLALQAEMEAERAYIVLELRQENWVEEMYETHDRKVGGDAGAWFRECDVRRDIRIEVVPESYYPQTEAQRRDDYQSLLRVAMMLQANGDPAVAANLFKRGVELYGSGLVLEEFQNDRVEARIRLERLRQVAKFLESESGVPVYDESGAVLPQMVSLVLQKANLIPEEAGQAVSIKLDRHDQFVENYAGWLLTSEGRGATAFERAVIKQVIEEHRYGSVEQQQYMKTLQYQAQIPDKQAEVMNQAIDQHLQESQAPPPAQKIAESLSIKYTDLATAPSPVQAEILQLAGIQVQPGQAEPLPSVAQGQTETMKAQGAMVAQAHKAQLEKDVASHNTQLDLIKQNHGAALKQAITSQPAS